MKFEFQDLIAIIKKSGTLANIDTLDPDKELKDQGVDSLDMANILLNIQEDFNVNIPTEDLDSLKSINQILTYLKNKQ